MRKCSFRLALDIKQTDLSSYMIFRLGYKGSVFQVTVESLSELENIRIYNALIQSLINGINELISLPERGNLWPIMAANNLILIGTESALGALSIVRTVIFICELTPNVSIW